MSCNHSETKRLLAEGKDLQELTIGSIPYKGPMYRCMDCQETFVHDRRKVDRKLFEIKPFGIRI